MKFYKAIDLSKIKVLSFDLDNTLYDCQSVLTKAENWFTTYLCDKYGLGGECVSYDYWAKIKSRILHENMRLEDDVTLLRAVSLVEAFKEKGIPLKGGFDEALSLVHTFIEHRSAGIVHKEVFSLLDKLKVKYPLVAVSNGNLDPSKLNINQYFEYDLRPQLDKLHRKPHSDLFNECAKIMKVKNDEILHIGDDPFTDVYGAVLANCKCVWLYKGYTGISPDEKHLKALPDIEINNILELSDLLL